MIQFPCPVCGAANSAPEEAIGSLVKCTGCGRSMGVPKQSGGGGGATKKCPICASDIPVVAIKCPRCQESLGGQGPGAAYVPPPVAQPLVKPKVDEDEFSSGEILGMVLGTLLCPGIAWLAASILLIVNFCQGKWRRGLGYVAVWVISLFWAVAVAIVSNMKR